MNEENKKDNIGFFYIYNCSNNSHLFDNNRFVIQVIYIYKIYKLIILKI